MTDIKDLINPYVWTAPEYNTSVLDKAWAHPELGRMMLNENPVPPSDAVVAAITDMAQKGNRYPDRAYRLREKLGKLHGLAAENIALANGSSETIDAMMRDLPAAGRRVPLLQPDVRDVPVARRLLQRQDGADPAA